VSRGSRRTPASRPARLARRSAALRRLRRLRGVGAAALVLIALAGCVAIPDGGGVESADIGSAEVDDDLLTQPDGPVADAGPAEIVQGFIEAGRGPQDRYSVAREFLSDGFRAEWNPYGGVLVTGSAISPVVATGGDVTLTVSVTAEVDSAGQYSAQTAGAPRELAFELVQDSGDQWRIAAAPDGTIVPPATFDSIFAPYALYYFDPGYDYLVPDLRWFLDTRQVASRIVAELLGGESEWLASGVLLTAFPSGTTLDRVDVDSGAATVVLNSAVLGEQPIAQWRMLQQLTASLVALRDVRQVGITVGGFPVAIPDFGAAPDRVLAVGSAPIGLGDGMFGVLGDHEVRPIAGIGDAVAGLGASGAAVGRAGDTAAVLGVDGVSRVEGESAVLVDDRPGLTVPSLDPEGFIWSSPATQPEALVAFDARGVAHPVATSLDGRIVRLAASRDGTRLLLALDGPDGPHLAIAGIDRDADLVPTELVAPIDIVVEGDRMLDATWLDGGTIAVLSSTGDRTAIDAYTIGGRRSPLGAAAGATQLVGGNGADGLRVLADGVVLRPSGESGWSATDLRASFLATQQ
jgi:hypothetical protein